MKSTVFAALFAGLLTAATPTPPSAWSDAYVYANGIRIHYWRTGAGSGKPVIVMAHGSSDDALCWTNLAKEITGQYDVIMVDARGHGWTDPPKAGDPADAQVEDLVGLIRELKLEKPILMGHSMGSFAVTWLAAKYPDLPRAVILEDPNLTGRPMTAAAKKPDAELRAVMIARNNQSEEELVATCMKNSPKWGRAECEVWAPSKRRHHPDTAVYPNNAARPPIRDLFAKITAPTLILKADADGDVRKTNEATAALLAQGKIVHITGAGHNVRRENKAMTLETLNAFLAGLKQVVVAIGSRNPVKVRALRDGLAPFFADFAIEPVEASSGVAAQPIGDDETQRGALTRARAALSLVPNAGHGVGLEGGVVEIGGVMFAMAWCAIVDRDGRTGLASTGRCPLPESVATLVRQGMELGPADDLVFGRQDSRLREGAVGLLTRGHIDRARFYAPAVTMALVPFLNPEHFPTRH